jgi:hypothetical protein
LLSGLSPCLRQVGPSPTVPHAVHLVVIQNKSWMHSLRFGYVSNLSSVLNKFWVVEGQVSSRRAPFLIGPTVPRI